MLRFVSAWALYGLAEKVQGRAIRSKVATAAGELSLPLADRRRRRFRQLAEVLERAGCDVPYYRDVFRKVKFKPARVASDARFLWDLPHLTKEIVREQGSRMLSRQYQAASLHARKTGGSTGPSTTVYYSAEALDWTAAVNIACLGAIGKRPHMRELHLASRFPETFPWRDRLKERLKCAALNRVNVFTDHFGPEGLDRLWRAIKRARPYLVQGHPSTLFALASHLRARQVPASGYLQVFESTGEVLDPRRRRTIERVLGCRAVDRYGSAEFGVLAYEMGARERLRVLDYVAWPETEVHESGTPELVFTGLLNPAMPLIRYRTGDLAELNQDEHGFYLSSIAGRLHDLVRIADRAYPTHYVQDLLDRLGGIDEFQLQERAGRPLLLRLVVPDVARRAAIAERIQSWWPGAVEVEFAGWDQMVRTGWRGKFRHLLPRSDAA